MKAGIDLGTTYSTVARYDRMTSKPEVILNRFGKELTPSVICFLDSGEILIGEDAKDMQAGGAGINAAAFKRGMGNPNFSVEANGKTYSAEQLSTILLKELIKEAEETSGQKIDQVVITVPAYFNDLQRKATIRAGEACGVKVLKIINEPTAAAISYGYKHSEDKTIMVYDLGGGTFDVTIVKVSKGNIDVIGTEGNHILGGKDWDAVLMNNACDRFNEEFEEDPRDDPATKNELIVASEDYKRLLTKSDSITFIIKYNGHTGRYDITRADFDAGTKYLLNATKDVIDKLMADLKLQWGDISEILLCGGSTRMPQVSEYLKQISGREVITHQDTDLAVAKGAAITAELYASTDTRLRGDVRISDVTAHSLGALSVSIDGNKYVNEIIIKRNSKIPASVKKPFRIQEGNMTDHIEVYTLQGESRVPTDCVVLAKEVITGFANDGSGTAIDIGYSYDENSVVHVYAYQGDEELHVDSEPVPEDLTFMSGNPHDMAAADDSKIARNIIICVDLSRSMKPSMEQVTSAITDFVKTTAGENTKFGLVGFGDKVGVIRDMTADSDVIIGALPDLKPNMLGRGTDGCPLGTAESMLANQPGVKMIVVLTDGEWGKRDFAVGEALNCRNSHIAVVAIGFGEADTSFLKQIATVDEGAVYTTLSSLGSTFSTIATAINNGSMGLRERK
ncbi:MAG: Hsp70 family protein [Candidatus Methanomethylophilus sp.]|nr:Hsp70 family protein [Methanomethylophilus sp.]